ncbi:hypothetical protein [Parageobacillus thermoglucosidasius]|uniref:Uncharacterized protein n=3 Tax=Anoxybacillaceae TaxID=3120669 RepID=A0AAN0YNY0_PARTM|nr:hypothetical protein [Parageobacillus thermoglucosidasius]KYD15528.1 hypothetical protein B4168_2988 [Anoxybacillus flavithermus]REK57784.1 MAG: hypothetical protein C6P36_06885 [Geobacillus sp.]AEH48964.1 hypothetical protein Geoth_3089 [Parageobacillus thermoglucosidasius C56-YS93]ALF09793.1 hypothetical protein AOT13_07170 [Parageobacillus thermoglucosidasius]ANZ29874.1 hypothetical protein BCV53_07180 [Parageobacillus thermoglucosidasius]
MEELVGFCSQCGKPIHCLQGFLNGVISDEKETLYCFSCYEENDNEQNRKRYHIRIKESQRKSP